MPSSPRTCMHCGQPNGPGKRELRPYGPGGRDVCAGCVFDGPPEREAEASRQFASVIDANDRAGVHTLLTTDGPRPLTTKGDA